MGKVAKLLSGIFGMKPQEPLTVRMPDPDSPAAKEAAKKKVAARSLEGGRASTIYTPYTNQQLGGTK